MMKNKDFVIETMNKYAEILCDPSKSIEDRLTAVETHEELKDFNLFYKAKDILDMAQTNGDEDSVDPEVIAPVRRLREIYSDLDPHRKRWNFGVDQVCDFLHDFYRNLMLDGMLEQAVTGPEELEEVYKITGRE